MMDDPQVGLRERLEARLTGERETLADLENAHHVLVGELREVKSSRAFQTLRRAQDSIARAVAPFVRGVRRRR